MEVQENGTFITVPVPEGADGKPWFFTRFAPAKSGSPTPPTTSQHHPIH